jgi:AcrR family transcriptional regulator
LPTLRRQDTDIVSAYQVGGYDERVPRIEATTVAEHRARQRAALLQAAERVLIDEGYEKLTFAAVAGRAGLARSSVYEYFASRADLVAALVEEVLPRWLTRLTEQMARARTPRTKLIAYVRTQLELVLDGSHQLAVALGRVSLPSAERARIAGVHAQFAPNIAGVLADLGYRDPRMGAAYVQAIVTEATRQLHAGADPAATIRTAIAFVVGGVGGGPELEPGK